MYCPSCGQKSSKTESICRRCGISWPSSASSEHNPPQKSIGFGHKSTGEDLVLQCSLCGGQDFAQDKGRLDSKWGVTSFKVIIQTCKACGHIELFNQGRSIFDFD